MVRVEASWFWFIYKSSEYLIHVEDTMCLCIVGELWVYLDRSLGGVHDVLPLLSSLAEIASYSMNNSFMFTGGRDCCRFLLLKSPWKSLKDFFSFHDFNMLRHTYFTQ